jgi:hypothetical protein
MCHLRHFAQVIWGSELMQYIVNQNLPTFFFFVPSSQYPAHSLRVAIGNLRGDYTTSTVTLTTLLELPIPLLFTADRALHLRVAVLVGLYLQLL